MRKTFTAEQFIQEFVIDAIRPLIELSPYHAFFVMCSAIEVLGKCQDNNDWQDNSSTSTVFGRALSLNALKKYKTAKHDLYKYLRCGLLHACMPTDKISIQKGKNNLSKNIIGCDELYDDIKVAWEELHKSGKIKKNMQETIFSVEEDVSGSTVTQQSSFASHSSQI